MDEFELEVKSTRSHDELPIPNRSVDFSILPWRGKPKPEIFTISQETREGSIVDSHVTQSKTGHSAHSQTSQWA